MALPALAAISVYGSGVSRMGLVSEGSFMLLDGYGEEGQRETQRIRGKSGGTIYLAEIDPIMQINLSAQVKQRRGLANYPVGYSLTNSALRNYLDPNGAVEDRQGFWPAASPAPSYPYGVLILRQNRWEMSRGGLHQVTLGIVHELAAFGLHDPTDADAAADPGVGLDDSDAIEAGGGDAVATLQAYRISYTFTPARGSGGTARSGIVTRLFASEAGLTEGQIYAYDNPPAATWTSPQSGGDGADWTTHDPTGTRDTAVTGIYTVTGIWHGNSNTSLTGSLGGDLTSVTAEADDDLLTKSAHGLQTGDRVKITAITGGTGLSNNTVYWAIRASASTFKLATSFYNAISGTGIDITLDGTGITLQRHFGLDTTTSVAFAVVIAKFTSGTTRLFMGDYASFAAWKTALSLPDNTLLTWVYEALSGETWHGTLDVDDPASFWRASTAQPEADGIAQVYHIIGNRSGVTTYHYVAVSPTNIVALGTSAGGPLDSIPDPPPVVYYGSPANTNAYEDYTAVYSGNDQVHDYGNGTTDLLGYPTSGNHAVAGPDLWCWQYAWTVAGGIAGKWDWKAGDAQTLGEWWELLTGSYVENPNTANYQAIVRLTAAGGYHWYKGSAATHGDPVAQTTGLVEW